MKKINVILVLLIAFFGCETSQPEIDNIPASKKPILQNKDVIYFVNDKDNNLADTFVVSKKEDYQMYSGSLIWERIILNYENVNKQSTLNFEVTILGAHRFAVHDYIPSNKYEMFDIEIDSVKYPVFVVENTSRKTNALPDSIYYSYKEGILGYYYSDTIYNRTKTF